MSTEENKPLGVIIQKFEEFELIIDSMVQNYNQISTKLNILVIDKNFFSNQNYQISNEIRSFIDKLKGINSYNNLFWLIQRKNNDPRKPNKVHNTTLIYPKILAPYFHDRFLFVYDVESKRYLAQLNIGHSINGFYMKENFDIFRVSEVNDDEREIILNQIKALFDFDLEKR